MKKKYLVGSKWATWLDQFRKEEEEEGGGGGGGRRKSMSNKEFMKYIDKKTFEETILKFVFPDSGIVNMEPSVFENIVKESFCGKKVEEKNIAKAGRIFAVFKGPEICEKLLKVNFEEDKKFMYISYSSKKTLRFKLCSKIKKRKREEIQQPRKKQKTE